MSLKWQQEFLLRIVITQTETLYISMKKFLIKVYE